MYFNIKHLVYCICCLAQNASHGVVMLNLVSAAFWLLPFSFTVWTYLKCLFLQHLFLFTLENKYSKKRLCKHQDLLLYFNVLEKHRQAFPLLWQKKGKMHIYNSGYLQAWFLSSGVLKLSLYIWKIFLGVIPQGIHTLQHRRLINKSRKGQLIVGWEESPHRVEKKTASIQTVLPQLPWARPKYRGMRKGGNLRSSSLPGDKWFVVR